MSADFLDVHRSLKGQAWRLRPTVSRDVQAMAQRLDVPEIVARIMAARGVGVEEGEAFLNPTLRALMPGPGALVDMEAGAERLARAIQRGERIGIISDYDVDGVSSAALVQRYLQAVGSSADVHIPDRISEGYGPSIAAVQALHARGATLLLTLDCGVLSHDPLASAADLGLDVVVVDHHQAGDTLPTAHAVINPNRHDDMSGMGTLCAAGVAFILLGAVNRVLRQAGWFSPARAEPNLLKWLEFVALATVCDVVPLAGLNRAYVTQGLKIMARRENMGLAALADVARLSRKPDPYALGFVLGPRLNAAGRIGSALDAYELLTSDDRGRVAQLAQGLEAMNRARQATELGVVEEALAQAELSGAGEDSTVIVVACEGWHPGVLGLASARLKDRYNRPAIVLGYTRNGVTAEGSGRSIPGVDLGTAVRAAVSAGLLLKGGGHAMAAGMTVARDGIGAFADFLKAYLKDSEGLKAERVLMVDGALSASAATPDLVELFDQAGPWGQGHPAPMFVLPAHRVVWADTAGSDHVRCQLAGPDGVRLKAIAFRALSTDLGEALLAERHLPMHIAGRLTIDDWNGGRVASLQIEDAAFVQKA